jgi:tetratricopeptide (TPR) repeat protein
MSYINSITGLISHTILLWLFNTTPVQGLTINHDQVTAQDWVKLGIEQIQVYRYSEAFEAFDQAIQLNPNSANAYRSRCWLSVQTNHYDQATKDCNKAVDLNNNDIESYLNLGIAYYRMNDFNNALAVYNQLIQQHPQEGRSYYNRALVWMENKVYLTAISDYNQALTFSQRLENAELAEIYIDRGIAYLFTQKPSKAMSDFSQAIALNPTSSRAYYNRGCTCYHQGQLENAMQDFNTVLSLDPLDAQAYLSRGKIYQQQALYAKALTDFNEAAQRFLQQDNQGAYLQAIALIQALKQWLVSADTTVLT